MTIIFYNIFLLFFRAGIRIASLWNNKANQWLAGRKNIFEILNSELSTNKSKLIWIHCSSLGEFEQGRPVIESFKTNFPNSKLLITFFSPSGYEIRKDYKVADWVFYLPMDSPLNAKKFFDIINPSLVVFVKYDFWYYYLTECKKRNIPLLMISAIFREEQPFFKWYGSFHRKMLSCFTYIFVQDENSETLLNSIDINNVLKTGDTRFDRVTDIAANFQSIEIIEKFCGNSKVLVAGSTWPEDEKIIKEGIATNPDIKLIIAPHEVNEKHLDEIKNLFPDAVFFSQLMTHDSQIVNKKIMIIDNIGMLSSLYHYATIAYVGGGFNKGIHNTLEAVVYGKPVIFGPKYRKFKEAVELVRTGSGISITNTADLSKQLETLLKSKDQYEMKCKNSFEFVQQRKGATKRIINYIQENRLFTS